MGDTTTGIFLWRYSIDPMNMSSVQRPAPGNRPRLFFVDNQAEHFCSHRLPLAMAALDAGWHVHVATPVSPAVTDITNAGLIHHSIALDRRGLNPWSELKTLRELLQIFSEHRPDLVHLRTIKAVIWGGIAARLSRVPAVVAHITGLGYTFFAQGLRAIVLRSLLPVLYRLAFDHRNLRVVFQNADDRSIFFSMGVISGGRTVLVRGSGVDVQKFSAQPDSGTHPIVIFPARLLWDKGLGEFVQAARQLRAKGSSARFVLVGDVDVGSRTSATTAQIEEWVRLGIVEWWGYRHDMPKVFAQARIVCLPSYWEGLPKALLEAAACARAVVTVDVPGCRDAVVAGKTGLIVPPKDPVRLAEALQALLIDPERCRTMGRLGREHMLAEFAEGRVIAEIMTVYRELLDAIGGEREK